MEGGREGGSEGGREGREHVEVPKTHLLSSLPFSLSLPPPQRHVSGSQKILMGRERRDCRT